MFRKGEKSKLRWSFEIFLFMLALGGLYSFRKIKFIAENDIVKGLLLLLLLGILLFFRLKFKK